MLSPSALMQVTLILFSLSFNFGMHGIAHDGFDSIILVGPAGRLGFQ